MKVHRPAPTPIVSFPNALPAGQRLHIEEIDPRPVSRFSNAPPRRLPVLRPVSAKKLHFDHPADRAPIPGTRAIKKGRVGAWANESALAFIICSIWAVSRWQF